MIIRFGVENHLSIRDRQELSMVASTLKDTETGLISTPALPKHKLLPVALIYGANASGKSNVVDALNFMRTCVLSSHNRGEPGGGVARKPFGLDDEFAAGLSKFDIEFVQGGVHYAYGFACSDKAFEEEWLYVMRGARRVKLFERKGQAFEFGRELKGRNRVIADLTRENSLFVSTAAQNGHNYASVYSMFESLNIDRYPVLPAAGRKLVIANNTIDKRVIKILNEINSGICTFRNNRNLSFFANVNFVIFNDMETHDTFKKTDQGTGYFDRKGFENNNIEFGRPDKNGLIKFFEIDQESSGTVRILGMLIEAFFALDNCMPLILDELDISLHTRAAEAVVALFDSPETNPKGAQLIATTHNTTLLNSELLRRDQIWFTEKDPHGATSLYPLSDFKLRDTDNKAKGYLQGRFGAVPFAGSVADLLKAD